MISLPLLAGRLIGLYQGAVFIYALMSWIPGGATGAFGTIYRALGTVCEPFIGVFRRILPTAVVGGAGLDLSPLVAILVLAVLQRLVYML